MSLRPSPLVHGAIGDAYGFCFEFAPPEHVAAHNHLRYHPHPELPIVPGAYSDDTQMQLALAELFVADEAWTPLAIADAFVRTYHRDPRPGYAKRFRALLESVSSGAELLATLEPTSERNGAAMRAPVVGLMGDLDEVSERATVQARVTHDSPGGVDSAVAAALMAHYFARNVGPKKGLTEFLEEHVPSIDWREPWRGPVPVHGVSTVRAAATAIDGASSQADLLHRCIALTGDVDSVATIALACASASAEVEGDLPPELFDGLERSAFGLPYLERVEGQVLVCAHLAEG